MPQQQEDGALTFFMAQHRAFKETLAERAGRPDLLPSLMSQACSSFEVNVEVQAQGQPDLACHKGCATCCTIRVVATAPEVLMAARYVRFAAPAFRKEGVDLPQRIRDADSATRNRSEGERVALRHRCPFISQGACVIYPVRPLACRSHASHDKRACAEAATGRLDSIPFSMPHMMVRSLIQNAMQSALRDFNMPWATYEFNHALTIALADESCEESWGAGTDVFGDAQINDVAPEEMAAIFDRIHGRIEPH